MTTLTKERRAEIRAAAEKATPGPWVVHRYVGTSSYRMLLADRGKTMHAECIPADTADHIAECIPADTADHIAECIPADTADHIANCDPQTILALLDALDAAEKAEPAAWMHPEAAWSNVSHDFVALHCRRDGPQPIPLYTHPPATREGWKLVPVEPTEEMIVDGHKQIDWCRNDQNTHRPGHPSQKPDGVGSDCGEDIRDAWAAMLAAAPEAK